MFGIYKRSAICTFLTVVAVIAHLPGHGSIHSASGHACHQLLEVRLVAGMMILEKRTKRGGKVARVSKSHGGATSAAAT